MSDDYFSNDYDSEYWNDVYYEEHKNEMGSGGYTGGVIRYLIYIVILIFGLCLAALCPPAGAIFILIAMKIKEG